MSGKKESRSVAAARSAGFRCQVSGGEDALLVGSTDGQGKRTFAHETRLYLPSHLYAIRCQYVIWATGQLDRRTAVTASYW